MSYWLKYMPISRRGTNGKYKENSFTLQGSNRKSSVWQNSKRYLSYSYVQYAVYVYMGLNNEEIPTPKDRQW